MNWTRVNEHFLRAGEYSIARSLVAGKFRYCTFQGRLEHGKDTLTVMQSFDSADEAKAFVEGLSD